MATQPTAPQASIADLTRQVTDDAVRLVRMEVELAKAELKETAIRIAVSAAMLMVALVILFVGVIYVLAAVPEHFGPKLFGDSWQGWAILGALLCIVAAVVGGLGARRLIGTFRTTPKTITSLKEDAEWAKRLTRRSDRST